MKKLYSIFWDDCDGETQETCMTNHTLACDLASELSRSVGEAIVDDGEKQEVFRNGARA